MGFRNAVFQAGIVNSTDATAVGESTILSCCRCLARSLGHSSRHADRIHTCAVVALRTHRDVVSTGANRPKSHAHTPTAVGAARATDCRAVAVVDAQNFELCRLMFFGVRRVRLQLHFVLISLSEFDPVPIFVGSCVPVVSKEPSN